MIGNDFLTEIQPLFLVGLPRGQFVADTEGPPPRVPAKAHSDAILDGRGKRKELSRNGHQATLQLGIDAMTDDVEEAALPARHVNLGRDLRFTWVVADEVAQVNDRNVGEVRTHCELRSSNAAR